MAIKGMEMCLAMALLTTLLWVGASAQASCTTAIVSLSPCLTFITGNSSAPLPSCCSQLANVVGSQPVCLCSLLNGGSSLGLAINQTQALALPTACNVKTPPVSQCNASGAPTASPADDTPASPANPTPASPVNPTTPSVPSTPSGSGSKTVPSNGVDTSSAISANFSLSTLFFLTLFTSFASHLTGF